MDLQKVILKIEKCLKLAESSNEHEASIALARAQTLMQKYNINHDDIELSQYSEEEADMDFANKVPDYINYLCSVIDEAFGTQCLFSTKWVHKSGRSYRRKFASFIGPNHVAKLASYTFVILFRQLQKARTDYLTYTASKFLDRKEKIAAGDIYCIAWIKTVNSKVKKFADPKRKETIDKFIDKNYGNLNQADINDRSDNLSMFDKAQAYQAGLADSSDVSLNTPMNGKETTKIGYSG